MVSMKKILYLLLLAAISSQTCIAQTSDVLVSESSQLKKAEFSGGNSKWMTYLTRNLNHNAPKEVNAPKGKYTVEVEFIIDPEGSITNVKAVSVPPLCKPCGAEAVRVVQSSPKWSPAMEDGKPVSYNAKQHITFMVSFNDSTYRGLLSAPILIKFENVSLREAIKKAATTGKIVYAQFISDRCESCNETAEMAMKSRSLSAVVNEKCIPIKIDLNYPDRKEFIATYNPTQSIGTYFIGGDEDLLHRFPKTTSRAADYIAEVEKALAKQVEGRVTMKELEEEWATNPGNITAMEMNLQKRLAAGWRTDNLLDVYVGRLPADSITSKRVLRFIAMQAPSLFSAANNLLRKDRALFNEMWNEIPLATRVSLNTLIEYRSLSRAIGLKNEVMAETVASYAAHTYDSDISIAARHAYDLQWLNYYKGTRDTAAALAKAIMFYDRYGMSINVSAIKKADSLALRKALDTAIIERIETPDGRFVNTRRTSYTPMSSFYAAELTQGAALVYNSSNNFAYLQKALTWAKRAREFSNFTDIQNTYAKLLYVTGNKAEAITLEKETIQNLKRVGRNPKVPEAILAQMEKNEKLKDRL